ncbi:hypothetical protein V5G24_23000 [Xanthobacter sp. VTT E-85241]|uniref:hypothetical protein n=1 Tax=Roseixanthobacter finlandensis TaxID=3119922 RepID=UPI00372B4833
MQPELSDIQPIGEWRPDIAGPFTQFSSVATNCISQASDYVPFQDFVPSGIDALPDTCRGAVAVKDSSGNVHIFAGTATALFKLNSNQWQDVTRSAGAYAVPDNGRWVFSQYGNRLIAADYTDDTQYFDLGLSTEFAALPNAPKCRTMTVVNNFVLMGNTFDAVDGARPKRIRWDGLDNTEAWEPSPVTQADFQDIEDSSGEVQAVVGYQNHAIVLKSDAIIRASYVGTPGIFNIETAETNQGTVGGNTVVVWGSRIFYLALDGFYLFNGAASVGIGDKKIDRTFLADLKPGSIPQIVASINPLKKIVTWAYVSNLSSNGLPDKMLVYNWTDQRWTLIELDVAQSFISLQAGKTIEDLGAEYGNLEDIPLSLDSAAYAGGSVLPASFNADGVLGYFNGEPMEATVECVEARLNLNGRALVSSIVVVTDAPTVDVKILSRNQLTETHSESASLLYSAATGEHCGRVDARFHKSRITLSGAWSYVRGLQFRAKATGVR